jgi:hypothetical protein
MGYFPSLETYPYDTNICAIDLFTCCGLSLCLNFIISVKLAVDIMSM